MVHNSHYNSVQTVLYVRHFFLHCFFIYLFSICFLSCFSIICFYKIKNFIKTNYRKTSKLYIKVSKKTLYKNATVQKTRIVQKTVAVALLCGGGVATPLWSGVGTAPPHSHGYCSYVPN